MFKYWHKVDRLNHINRLLLMMLITTLAIILSLILLIATLPSRYEFWLTPSMAANGGLLKENEVSAEYVQGFVATLLPSLNTWSRAGGREFSKNLNAYRYYFTPRHQHLMNDILTAYKNTQLFDRTQIASLYQFMSAEDVKPIGHNTWEVHVVLRITQRLKNDSNMVIADKVVEYHLRVVKVTLSRLQNPFQLALDGYTAPEHLKEDLLATKTEDEHASI